MGKNRGRSIKANSTNSNSNSTGTNNSQQHPNNEQTIKTEPELFPSWSLKEDYMKSKQELMSINYGFCLLPHAYFPEAFTVADFTVAESNENYVPHENTTHSMLNDKISKTESSEKDKAPRNLPPVFTVTTWDGREIFSMKGKS